MPSCASDAIALAHHFFRVVVRLRLIGCRTRRYSFETLVHKLALAPIE